MLQVLNLHKRYGDLHAVDGVSFEVRAGEIYGLLGPNGAGKTTSLSMISGLLAPDEGHVLFDGIDMAAEPLRVKAQMGVVPQETAVYESLSARENLMFWAGLYGLSGADKVQAVDRVLDQVELTARARDAVKTYSGGMKRRLNLAMGLVHSPRIVLLDEPTVGIDPQARLNILEMVRGIASEGMTVLYTTHYLEEAEALCDRIGIMDHGKLLAEGTLEELKRQAGNEEIVTVRGTFDPDLARDRLGSVAGARLVSADATKLVLSTSGSGKGAVQLLSEVLSGDLDVEGVSIRAPSLDSLFLNLTGRELRD